MEKKDPKRSTWAIYTASLRINKEKVCCTVHRPASQTDSAAERRPSNGAPPWCGSRVCLSRDSLSECVRTCLSDFFFKKRARLHIKRGIRRWEVWTFLKRNRLCLIHQLNVGMENVNGRVVTVTGNATLGGIPPDCVISHGHLCTLQQ